MSPIGKKPVAERITTQATDPDPKSGDVAGMAGDWYRKLDVPDATSPGKALTPEERERFLRKMAASGW